MSIEHLKWWNSIRHGGLFLDTQRLNELAQERLPDIPAYQQKNLRWESTRFTDNPGSTRTKFASFTLENICKYDNTNGKWYRGSNIGTDWSRPGLTGDPIRPNHLWIGKSGGCLPVFIDSNKRLGIGRGKRIISRTLQWLRKGKEQLAIVTNGFQWRIVFAGLDYEAFCEWDIEQWFAEGDVTEELKGLIALLNPNLWTLEEGVDTPRLVQAINESRKGQADLSAVLGERVRQATEWLIQAHAPVLNNLEHVHDYNNIYLAAVRMVMRLVIILFAESREGLLPKDIDIYNNSYSLQGLRELLDRIKPYRLRERYSAWPRVISLMRLVYYGSHHEKLPVPSYGGELFAPGMQDDPDEIKKVIYLFEQSCFDNDVMNDFEVWQILDLLSRTKIKLRQGRAGIWVTAPVDFSSLDSEYIGILYEGLLDFELRTATAYAPVVFLSVGNQPALPLTTLENMDDKAVKNLLEKMKDTSSEEVEEGGSETDDEQVDEIVEEEDSDDSDEEIPEDEIGEEEVPDDQRLVFRERAHQWALKACEVGGLVKKPRGTMTPEKQMQYDRILDSKANQLITKLVLPGEWYLVRWGGTRKGSGTFYTRPQLAIPTVHRTLQPLAYDPPLDRENKPNPDAPASSWIPKKPEEILSLKVCDPACGSGSFLLAALRFLTEAIYESLILHDRVKDSPDKAILELIYGDDGKLLLSDDTLPCRYEDDDFEVRTKVHLRRYIVERCLYGVDLDPLAVELSRLSLWIETLDSGLPMTFLNHKIKIGNSLVGAWFDQFLHYPVMAWMREGGDKNHTNGVHYKKEEWTKAISARRAEVKSDLIRFIDSRDFPQLFPLELPDVKTLHQTALKTLQEIHDIGIADVDLRAGKYQSLLDNPDFQQLKDAFDLYCALWFWSPEWIDKAPLPTQFAQGKISEEAWKIVRETAAERRFFHWELEFPDVFNDDSSGFDAVMGNPPWDISKPNSKEFFSVIDPLYRSYGKQEAINKQKEYFNNQENNEHNWLKYNAYFRSMSHWVKYAGFPFGDRVTTDSNGREKHDFPIGNRGKLSFETSADRHKRWKKKRIKTTGFSDENHVFRHQGGGDINLYKTFIEQAHTLLNQNGRLGLIVPSGLYSDFGSGQLRDLFINNARWEWLFGFENREGIFDIHRSYKFNPVIIEKGSNTDSIHTAFMRRNISDWEKAENFTTEYQREQILQFSPYSKAILEIQSERDLDILTKIYTNSVLLGDQSDEGWGIQYRTEFHMTNDSKLFPPRPKWEEWGYRPDEYSRWIKGPWQPIEALYAELGVQPLPEGERRIAQPPYDRLPIPRADIPEGIILSREANFFIREDDIPIVTFTDANGKVLKIKQGRGKDAREVEIEGPAVALPLYEGRMIGQFDFSQKGWVSGKGRTAVWRDIPWERKVINPQYLMGFSVYDFFTLNEEVEKAFRGLKTVFMAVGSATNSRSMIAGYVNDLPCGNAVPPLMPNEDHYDAILGMILNSVVYDFVMRCRLVGLNLNYFVIAETPLLNINHDMLKTILISSEALNIPNNNFSNIWIRSLAKNGNNAVSMKRLWGLTPHERQRLLAISDSISMSLFSCSWEDSKHIYSDCDYPISDALNKLNPKGFWRVDKDKPPELRQTVLTLVAFHDLQKKIEECGGDRDKGIEAFLNQNDGEGWMLPETLRLADYGLGHDDRAKEHQPVRSMFGPRFYKWQLAQSPEESWKECHLHARNLLGKDRYKELLEEIENPVASNKKKVNKQDNESYRFPGQLSLLKDPQGNLFE